MSVSLFRKLSRPTALAASLAVCLGMAGTASADVKRCFNTKYPLTQTIMWSSCKVGDTGPGGGPIFFVDYHGEYRGFDYLEAAPASAEADMGPQPWCNAPLGTLIGVNDWAANAVGRGQANTNAMLGVCASGAANAADAYVSPTGKDDWFLPSMGELMLMYTNLRQAGQGAFGSAGYWSSTERGANHAWVQYFHIGYQDTIIKVDFLSVRPVRAF